MTDQLKAYWIRNGITTVWVSHDPNNPWGESGWSFNPIHFKKRHPKACLFSEQEVKNKLIKVWLYHPDISIHFRNKEDRDMFCFWMNPLWLEELPLL
jgi:hypothetical protein